MYKLLSQLIPLVEEYENTSNPADGDVDLFGQWLYERNQLAQKADDAAPEWLGKASGRTTESVINTSLVHLYRYARLHAKAALSASDFATPDEMIYLINLKVFGPMTKTALIRHNVHEKSAGIQIINRLIQHGLVEQVAGDQDKRNKIISLTDKGLEALDQNMDKIRQASIDVTGNINNAEKMELIRILTKLEDYHQEQSKGLLP